MSDRHDYYETRLYPLQDEVLDLFREIDTGFYLTGGTVISRVYCHHRFSDDLDFFVNDAPQFGRWVDRLTQTVISQQDFVVTISQREDTFVRLFVDRDEINLKIDFVNDVPAYAGEVEIHPRWGKIDNPKNLLANKITAVIDRREPKDFADIWALVTQFGLSVESALTDATSKAAGIFPVFLAKVLLSASHEDWSIIRWKNQPSAETFLQDLHSIGEKLLLE